MNASALTTEVSKLVARAIREGVQPGKLTIPQIVAELETQKHILLTMEMDLRRAVAAHQTASEIVVPFKAPGKG